ncbi:MAG: CAP domain-containing protein [Treponema sp.]|nr:CAP domain-containing protein [Treponema sp.]
MKRTLLLTIIFCFINNLYADDWDAAWLDTARHVDYLSAVEKDVIFELNKARSDPRRYAESYIRPRFAYFSGKIYAEPDKPKRTTQEGIIAVQACISAMMKQQPAPPLMPERGLCLGARDHVNDQAGGAVGHTGSDRSDPVKRINRYGQWASTWGENIAYGSATGRDIVIDLLIDDGVPNRGHYANNMNKMFNKTGVAVGPHRGYGTICVIDFAGSYITDARYAPDETWTALLANKSSYTWSKLYIAGQKASSWGTDRLAGAKGSVVVKPDDRITAQLPKDTTVYDIKIVTDTEDTYYLFGLDRTRHQAVPVPSGVQYLFYVEKFPLTTQDTSKRK